MLNELQIVGDMLEGHGQEDELCFQPCELGHKIMTIKERIDEIKREVDLAYEVQRNM